MAVLAWAMSAMATPTVFVSDGLGVMTPSLSSASGAVTYTGKDSLWSVVVLTSVSYSHSSGQGSAVSPVMTFSVLATSLSDAAEAASHPLVITFASDGFGPTSSSFAATLNGHSVSGTGPAVSSASGSSQAAVTLNSFYDAGDRVAADPSATVLTASGALSDYNGVWRSSPVNLASSYSLTEVVTIQAAPTAGTTYYLNGSVTTVPDGGATAILLGATLSLIELIRRRLA